MLGYKEGKPGLAGRTAIPNTEPVPANTGSLTLGTRIATLRFQVLTVVCHVASVLALHAYNARTEPTTVCVLSL